MRYHLTNAAAVVGVLCAIALANFAFKGIYPFGERVFAWGDLTQQGIPFLYGTWDVLNGAASPYFQWHILGGIGAGAPPIFLIPFHLPLLFIDRADIFFAVSIVILYKMCLMGLTMYAFATRFEVQRSSKILAGVLYGSGACVLIHYQIEGVMFDSAILFPILMLGFRRLLENDRPLLYIGMLALFVAKNFYVGAMICMFMFFASLAWLFDRYFFDRDRFDRTLRAEFSSKCRLLTLSTLAGLLIAALFWLPSIFSLASSDRLTAGTQGGLLDTYLRAITKTSFFSLDYFANLLLWAACFFMGSGLMLAALHSGWRTLSLWHKLSLAIILGAMIIPGTELLWHGGSRLMWPIRFGFILTFVLIEIFLAVEQKKPPNSDAQNSNAAILTAIEIAVFMPLCYFLYCDNQVDLMFDCVFSLPLCFLFYRFAPRNWKPIAVAFELFCLQLFWIGFPFAKIYPVINVEESFWTLDVYNRYLSTATELGRELDRSKLNPLVRARDFENAFNNNYALVSNTYSIGAFYGGVSKRVKETYSALGYGRSTVQRVLDSGGTLFSDALLNVRSAFTLETSLNPELYVEDRSIRSVRWFEHRYTLPPGMMISKDVELEHDPFAFQNEIFRSIANRNDELIEEYPLEIVDGRARLRIDGRRELYLYGDDQWGERYNQRRFSMRLDGRDVRVPNLTSPDNLIYPAEFNSNLIDLGTFRDETIELEFRSEDGYDFEGIHVGGLDLDKMISAFEEINSRSTVERIDVGFDSISIGQRGSSGGVMFLPVPFDRSWHCEINGVEAQIKPVFGNFIGLEVPRGDNSIVLKYSPDRSRGWMWSAMGLLLAIVVVRLKKFNAAIDLAFGVFYVMIGAVLLLAVYVIPLIAALVV